MASACAVNFALVRHSSRRGAGEAVGAVEAGAGGLADGVKVENIGPAVEVGVDAAAGEMGGGHDRDRLAGNIHAVAQAARMDIRETFANKLRGHR